MPKARPGGTTYDDEEYKAMQARVAELEAKLAQKPRGREPYFEVSEKTGALMLKGLGRFPTTLYAEQWQRAKALIDEKLDDFIEEHREELSWKNEAEAS